MHPTICTIGPVTIYSYGLMLVIAFTIATALARQQARRQNIDPELIFTFNFRALLFGVIGARLFYVIENLGFFYKYPLEAFMLQHGGLSWFGGLFLGGFFACFYLKIKKLPIYTVLDLIVPFLALAQAIGRIGCLLNGCCFGKVSLSGVYFPVHQSVLVPTQAYSSILLIIIFILLRNLQDKPHRQGQIFFAYLLMYSVQRFFIEFLRADNAVIFSGLTLFQVLSVLVFCLALFKIIRIRR